MCYSWYNTQYIVYLGGIFLKALVVKKNANQFITLHDGKTYACVSRGKHKETGIFVGDNVKVKIYETENVIEEIFERKNCLVRPPVANLDQMLIVISPVPKPDFLLIDKLILLCFMQNIIPILCVNKTDISSIEFLQDIKSQYSQAVQIIELSAKTKENLHLLQPILKNKISAFAGQSAVGKSMLTNALLGENKTQVGELSKKIDRGKNTTRHTEIFEIEKESYLVDTAGFSFLDEQLIFEEEPNTLWRFYPEMIAHAANCKFLGCTHTKEGAEICGVAAAAKTNQISLQRFLRYQQLYAIMKENWRRRYGK